MNVAWSLSEQTQEKTSWIADGWMDGWDVLMWCLWCWPGAMSVQRPSVGAESCRRVNTYAHSSKLIGHSLDISGPFLCSHCGFCMWQTSIWSVSSFLCVPLLIILCCFQNCCDAICCFTVPHNQGLLLTDPPVNGIHLLVWKVEFFLGCFCCCRRRRRRHHVQRFANRTGPLTGEQVNNELGTKKGEAFESVCTFWFGGSCILLSHLLSCKRQTKCANSLFSALFISPAEHVL